MLFLLVSIAKKNQNVKNSFLYELVKDYSETDINRLHRLMKMQKITCGELDFGNVQNLFLFF